MAQHERAQARTREGVVVSTAMEKTVVVAVRRRVRHPRYRKYVTVSKRFLAHDESNACSVGDRVIIAETRPLSKRKRWRVRSIVERAVADVEIVDEFVQAEAEAEHAAPGDGGSTSERPPADEEVSP